MDDIETGAAEQPADLRSVISAAVDVAEKASEGKTEPVTAPEPAKPASESSEKPESASAAGERPRGPDGKFAPKDKPEDGQSAAAEPAAAQKAEAAPKAEEKSEAVQAPAEKPSGAVEPPAHWSAADKEKFNAIPAEGRAHFLDMYKRLEGWYTPKLQRLTQLENDYGPVAELFKPHSESLKQQGKTPAHIIQAWASVEQGLMAAKSAADRGQYDENGAAIVARIIKGYNINPAHIAHHLTSGADIQTRTTELPPEVVGRLNRLEQAEQERIASHARASEAAIQQQLDTFANEKDGDGNLKNPFFAEVEKDMSVLAQLDAAQGKTPNISDLYRRATRANDEVYQRLLDLNAEKEAKRVAAEKKARAEAAQRAAVSVSGTPGPGQSERQRTGGKSLRETIEAKVSELT